MLLQTCSGIQSGILWHGIKMNQKRNQILRTQFSSKPLSILFSPEPVPVTFGIKSQHIFISSVQV